MNTLVTGGASGLGLAITRRLAKEQTGTVYFTWHRSSEMALALEKEFPNVKGVVCDFTNNESVTQLLAAMNQMELHVIVNNAFSGMEMNYFHKTDASYFEQNFSRNVMPVIRITQQAIHLFRKQKSGKIITILSSYLINKPPIGLSEYVASKNYLLSLSKSWAVENGRFNITSNCISPSTMQTALTASTDERVMEEMINVHPLKRLITPEEVADTVAYLTQASAHLNGENIVLNAASDID